MTSIRIVDLDKRFGEVKALADINLEIGKGEFFTLLGPSGCGKTTLLRTIAGFYRQERGEVWLGDEKVDEVPAHRRDTGMVFQNYAVFPHMTVFENVAYGLKVRKLPKAEIGRRVASALKTVHLEGYEERTPDQLSGGQQQRVGLARAMAIEPRVLLFDEPLSNLDAKLRVEMRDEIRAMQKELGITSIYVTHDQEEALVISDRIAVVSAGRIQQVGAPWEIYKNPATLFVASFVGKVNLLEGRLGSSLGPGLREFRAGSLSLAVPDEGSEVGRKVIVAFRPEDAIEEPEADVPNRLEGKVAGSSFLGTVAIIELDVGGERLLVERHRPRSGDIPAAGAALSVALPPESLLLFDLEKGGRLGGAGAA